MTKVFADTDVCIDLLSGRKPHNEAAEKFFSLGESGKVIIHVSSLSFANIDYLLHSQYSSGRNPRMILAQFKTLVTVLAVDNRTIDLAIASDFKDFEDAIQYNTAIEHNIDILITRNIKDYKKATIKIMTPESFVANRK